MLTEPSKDDLGDRMKSHEATYENVVPANSYMVLRIDGRAFSKFTAAYQKPYDVRIEDAMNQTAIALRKEFHASLVYTQSDEITVVVPPKWNEKGQKFEDHIFGGRVQKIVSVAASRAAVAFDRALTNRVNDTLPTFDCRVMTLDESEAANAIYWRILDCERNAVSGLFRYTFGHRAMQCKPCSVMKTELGDDWDGLDDNRKIGRFIKKVTNPEIQEGKNRSYECVIFGRWINGKRPVHKEIAQLIREKEIVSEWPVWEYKEETDASI